MHLTDNEILEHLTNSNLTNAHLEECDSCQRRLENRSRFRAKLDQSYQSSQVELAWERLEEEFDRSFHGQQQQKMESKIKKLQFGLVSLAACLCLVVLIPLLSPNELAPTIESELALVIDENHQLQRSVELSTPYGSLQTVALQTLRIQLQQIDSEIQLSYLEGLPKSEKLKLWQARKKLLVNSIKSLKSDSSSNTKSI